MQMHKAPSPGYNITTKLKYTPTNITYSKNHFHMIMLRFFLL